MTSLDALDEAVALPADVRRQRAAVFSERAQHRGVLRKAVEAFGHVHDAAGNAGRAERERLLHTGLGLFELAAVNGVREKPLRLMRTAPVPIIAAKFSGSAAFSSRRTYSRYVSGAPAGTGPSTAAENARCSAQNGAAHGVSEMPQLPETDVVMPCRSSASALQPRSGCTSAWRWMSMKPGQSILPAASSTAAPGGAGRPGPTASIVSPARARRPKTARRPCRHKSARRVSKPPCGRLLPHQLEFHFTILYPGRKVKGMRGQNPAA